MYKRQQKNLFDDHDLLILQLPGTLEEGMKAKSEYIRSFAGKETPLVFLCPAGFSEEEEKLEEQLEKNGFRLVARLTGIPSADGMPVSRATRRKPFFSSCSSSFSSSSENPAGHKNTSGVSFPAKLRIYSLFAFIPSSSVPGSCRISRSWSSNRFFCCLLYTSDAADEL